LLHYLGDNLDFMGFSGVNDVLLADEPLVEVDLVVSGFIFFIFFQVKL
jgi:hypothetical protein